VDRNALRPLRYTLTSDNLLIVGSETGMVVVPESSVVQKGRMGPGEMIAVDLAEGVVYHDRAIKDRIAADRPYGAMVKGFRKLSDLPPAAAAEARPVYDRADLTRRQIAAGMTLEDMELILAPMVEDARKRSARWATTRRSPSFRTSRARSAISSARISAR
jgi:glutamate synthase (NADPH/NADH) large chain